MGQGIAKILPVARLKRARAVRRTPAFVFPSPRADNHPMRATENSETPSETKARACRGALLCLFFLVAPLVYSYRLTSFLHAKELVLYLTLIPAAASLAWGGGRISAALHRFLPLWVLAAFAVVMHLGFRLPAVPFAAIEQCAHALTLLLAAVVWHDVMIEPRWARRTLVALVTSVVATAALGLAQYAGVLTTLFPVFPGNPQRMYSVFGNQDLLGGYLALAIPFAVRAAARDARRPWPAMLALLVMLPALALSMSRTAWLAAVVGVIVAFPYRSMGHRRAVATLLLLVAGGAASMLVSPDAFVTRVRGTFGVDDEGGRARVWLWNGTARMIVAHPVIGVGPGNYPYWAPRYLAEALHAPGGERLYRTTEMAEHPHSEPLALVAELGLPGAVCALWMLARLARRRGAAWGGLAAWLVFASMNQTLHSPPHALAGIVFASLLLRRFPVPERVESPRTHAVTNTACATALAAFFALTTFWPGALLKQGQDAQVTRNPEAEAIFARVARWPWPQAAANEFLAMELLRRHDYTAAERAIEQASRGLDTGRVYLLRGTAYFGQGRIDEAHEAFLQCVYRWPGSVEAWRALEHTTPEADWPRLELGARRWGLDTVLRGDAEGP